MDFRILGPLEVLEDGRALDLGGQKQRALLAVLLLEANRVVSSGRSNASTDVYFAQSTNGGAGISPNVKVTSASTNETVTGADLGNQYGDYEGIDASGGVVHPIWTDRRASVAALDEEAFTAALTTK